MSGNESQGRLLVETKCQASQNKAPAKPTIATTLNQYDKGFLCRDAVQNSPDTSLLVKILTASKRTANPQQPTKHAPTQLLAPSSGRKNRANATTPTAMAKLAKAKNRNGDFIAVVRRATTSSLGIGI